MNKIICNSILPAIAVGLFLAGTSLDAKAMQPSMMGVTSGHGSTVLISAATQNGAEQFVESVAQEGIGFLSDTSLSQDQRKQKFKNLLKKNFDMKTIGRFALGRYWRNASPKQQAEYFDLFEKMILNVYARRFDEYSGQQLVVTGSRSEGERDMLVFSVVKPEKGPEIKVDWRIRGKKGQHKVIDVIVEGVSMTVTQRADFASVIQRGGGDLEVLLDHLRGQ